MGGTDYLDFNCHAHNIQGTGTCEFVNVSASNSVRTNDLSARGSVTVDGKIVVQEADQIVDKEGTPIINSSSGGVGSAPAIPPNAANGTYNLQKEGQKFEWVQSFITQPPLQTDGAYQKLVWQQKAVNAGWTVAPIQDTPDSPGQYVLSTSAIAPASGSPASTWVPTQVYAEPTYPGVFRKVTGYREQLVSYLQDESTVDGRPNDEFRDGIWRQQGRFIVPDCHQYVDADGNVVEPNGRSSWIVQIKANGDVKLVDDAAGGPLLPSLFAPGDYSNVDLTLSNNDRICLQLKGNALLYRNSNLAIRAYASTQDTPNNYPLTVTPEFDASGNPILIAGLIPHPQFSGPGKYGKLFFERTVHYDQALTHAWINEVSKPPRLPPAEGDWVASASSTDRHEEADVFRRIGNVDHLTNTQYASEPGLKLLRTQRNPATNVVEHVETSYFEPVVYNANETAKSLRLQTTVTGAYGAVGQLAEKGGTLSAPAGVFRHAGTYYVFDTGAATKSWRSLGTWVTLLNGSAAISPAGLGSNVTSTPWPVNSAEGNRPTADQFQDLAWQDHRADSAVLIIVVDESSNVALATAPFAYNGFRNERNPGRYNLGVQNGDPESFTYDSTPEPYDEVHIDLQYFNISNGADVLKFYVTAQAVYATQVLNLDGGGQVPDGVNFYLRKQDGAPSWVTYDSFTSDVMFDDDFAHLPSEPFKVDGTGQRVTTDAQDGYVRTYDPSSGKYVWENVKNASLGLAPLYTTKTLQEHLQDFLYKFLDHDVKIHNQTHFYNVSDNNRGWVGSYTNIILELDTSQSNDTLIEQINEFQEGVEVRYVKDADQSAIPGLTENAVYTIVNRTYFAFELQKDGSIVTIGTTGGGRLVSLNNYYTRIKLQDALLTLPGGDFSVGDHTLSQYLYFLYDQTIPLRKINGVNTILNNANTAAVRVPVYSGATFQKFEWSYLEDALVTYAQYVDGTSTTNIRRTLADHLKVLFENFENISVTVNYLNENGTNVIKASLIDHLTTLYQYNGKLPVTFTENPDTGNTVTLTHSVATHLSMLYSSKQSNFNEISALKDTTSSLQTTFDTFRLVEFQALLDNLGGAYITYILGEVANLFFSPNNTNDSVSENMGYVLSRKRNADGSFGGDGPGLYDWIRFEDVDIPGPNGTFIKMRDLTDHLAGLEAPDVPTLLPKPYAWDNLMRQPFPWRDTGYGDDSTFPFYAHIPRPLETPTSLYDRQLTRSYNRPGRLGRGPVRNAPGALPVYVPSWSNATYLGTNIGGYMQRTIVTSNSQDSISWMDLSGGQQFGINFSDDGLSHPSPPHGYPIPFQTAGVPNYPDLNVHRKYASGNAFIYARLPRVVGSTLTYASETFCCAWVALRIDATGTIDRIWIVSGGHGYATGMRVQVDSRAFDGIPRRADDTATITPLQFTVNHKRNGRMTDCHGLVYEMPAQHADDYVTSVSTAARNLEHSNVYGVNRRNTHDFANGYHSVRDTSRVGGAFAWVQVGVGRTFEEDPEAYGKVSDAYLMDGLGDFHFLYEDEGGHDTLISGMESDVVLDVAFGEVNIQPTFQRDLYPRANSIGGTPILSGGVLSMPYEYNHYVEFAIDSAAGTPVAPITAACRMRVDRLADMNTHQLRSIGAPRNTNYLKTTVDEHPPFITQREALYYRDSIDRLSYRWDGSQTVTRKLSHRPYTAYAKGTYFTFDETPPNTNPVYPTGVVSTPQWVPVPPEPPTEIGYQLGANLGGIPNHRYLLFGRGTRARLISDHNGSQYFPTQEGFQWYPVVEEVPQLVGPLGAPAITPAAIGGGASYETHTITYPSYARVEGRWTEVLEPVTSGGLFAKRAKVDGPRRVKTVTMPALSASVGAYTGQLYSTEVNTAAASAFNSNAADLLFDVTDAGVRTKAVVHGTSAYVDGTYALNFFADGAAQQALVQVTTEPAEYEWAQVNEANQPITVFEGRHQSSLKADELVLDTRRLPSYGGDQYKVVVQGDGITLHKHLADEAAAQTLAFTYAELETLHALKAGNVLSRLAALEAQISSP